MEIANAYATAFPRRRQNAPWGLLLPPQNHLNDLSNFLVSNFIIF
jgi:hypothetical protein